MNLYKLWMALVDAVFPRRCPVCDGPVDPEEGLVHARCRKKLVPVTNPYCLKCGRQITSPVQEYCFQCRKKTPEFTQGRSLFSYQGAVKGSMYRFKYSNKREYARFYAEEAGKTLAPWIARTGAECIIPVPMYKEKKRERGYNQAESFAAELSRVTGIPVEKHLIVRNRRTRALKTLTPTERRKELEKAFSLTPEYRAELIQKGSEGKICRRVILADDIYTTGSTADAISRVLREAGVREVYVICVCSARGNN